MVLDYIIYGMHFKIQDNQILRIEKKEVVDVWTEKEINIHQIPEIIMTRMLNNFQLYQNILVKL
jgi:hypothetical protein